jgi:uncharacterized protein (DUF362 family)
MNMINSPRITIDTPTAPSQPRTYRVILRKCEVADPDRVRGILNECFTDLDRQPSGNVLIKPNVVTANRSYIHHSYTDPRLVAEAVKLSFHYGARNVTVGESGGYGVPSKLFLREAGYLALKKLGARVVDFNLEPAYRTELAKGLHHKSLQVPRSVHQADFRLWMPKLKYHVCCTITCALKLNVGILLHKERMLYHDDRLDEKIVDILEVGYPDLIITDAIEIGTGFEGAPQPVHLGVVLAADDPVAMDIVACRLLGRDPGECRHLMLAMQRGYGPPDMDQVRVEGDISLDQLTSITKSVESPYQDIEKVETPIRFYSGVDPDRGRLCHGGCLTAVKGCLATIDKRRPGSVAEAKPGTIITGVYRGDVDAADGTALLVGSCTSVEGDLKAARVRRIRGCPVGARQLLLSMPAVFGMPNPLLSPRDVALFLWFCLEQLASRAGCSLVRLGGLVVRAMGKSRARPSPPYDGTRDPSLSRGEQGKRGQCPQEPVFLPGMRPGQEASVRCVEKPAE